MTTRPIIDTRCFVAVLALANLWVALSLHAQPPAESSRKNQGATTDVDHERQQILESDRWRRTMRDLDEWLSVQTIYSEGEVAAIQANLRENMASKSAAELEQLLKDMEDRLKVLTSPEAKDARLWLADFMAVARNPEQQLGRQMPDVWNMTASQIRQEIQWLQQTRAQRQQTHSSFQQSRAVQAQVARDAKSNRQTARSFGTNRADWPANNPRRPSQYAPQPELRPQPLSLPWISPWGHPIDWW